MEWSIIVLIPIGQPGVSWCITEILRKCNSSLFVQFMIQSCQSGVREMPIIVFFEIGQPGVSWCITEKIRKLLFVNMCSIHDPIMS